MRDIFTFADPEPVEPRIIRAWRQEALGDNPDTHRWRATWFDTYSHGLSERGVIGIQLTAYPVIKPTPCGAWVDPHAYLDMVQSAAVGWRFSGQKRWVANDSGAAFAKCTQDEALFSIAYRLMRWNQKIIRDVRRLREAGEVCRKLLPEIADRFTRGIEGPF